MTQALATAVFRILAFDDDTAEANRRFDMHCRYTSGVTALAPQAAGGHLQRSMISGVFTRTMSSRHP